MSQAPPDLSQQFADFFPDPKVGAWAKCLMERIIDGHICVPCSDLGTVESSTQTSLGLEGNIESPNQAVLGLEGNAWKWVSVGDESRSKPFVLYNKRILVYILWEK